MTEAKETLLSQIEYHLHTATALLNQYRGDYVQPGPHTAAVEGVPVRKPQGSNRSVREWVGWLRMHGPSYRGEIQEATGINLTAKPSQVLDWSGDMVTWAETAVPGDTLCRTTGFREGRGRPPSIYFLWSQRFDVLPKFGVGPVRPDPAEPVELATGGVVGPDDLGPLLVGDGAPLLGVLSPTDENYSGNLMDMLSQVVEEDSATDDPDEDLSWDEPEDDEPAPRAVDMAEWHERHNAYFDMLVQTETKPTDEERAELYADLPEGVVDKHATIALAYGAALQRNADNG